MCCHDWVHESNSKICRICGIETREYGIDTYNKYSAPLFRSYDRLARFKLKVNKLLGIHAGPHFNDPIWALLEKKQFNTPQELRKILRMCNLKNKHYDCVRIFCTIFTRFRVTIVDVYALREHLLYKFKNIFLPWSVQHQMKSFLSYDFLLRLFLEEIHSPLVVYLKPQTCKRRLKKYLTMLRFIQAPRDCRRLNRTTANSRSQSGWYFVDSRPCLLP